MIPRGFGPTPRPAKNGAAELRQMKADRLYAYQTSQDRFRLLFDGAAVSFIYVVTVQHMWASDYTVARMARFWTMWGCWSCAAYFAVAFFRTAARVLGMQSARKPRLGVAERLADACQHTAVVVGLTVTLLFWLLYVQSPGAVFRIDGDWQPTVFEALYYTHFEHTVPLLLLLVDCAVFQQGNRHAKEAYPVTRFAPLVAASVYVGIVLYDFFCCDIRPYPFMDQWPLSWLLSFVLVFFTLLTSFFNPLALFVRTILPLF